MLGRLVYTSVYTLGVPVATRRLPRAERQASLLRAAARAFAERGFTGTAMDDVAAEAGVTRLIVYRHFGSKEELYRAVLRGVLDRLAATFVAGLERGEGSGLGVRTLLSVAREDPDAFRLLWRQAVREPEFAADADEVRDVLVRAARDLLGDTAGRAATTWAPQAVVAFLLEAVLSWLDGGDAARDDEFVAAVADGLRGLRRAWA